MIRRLLNRFLKHSRSNNFWSGNYATWKEAEEKCTGYDDQHILDKVAAAINRVKDGKAAYERDSVAFTEYTYSENVRLAILEAVPIDNGQIIDFGGSLGSLYFQYRRFLNKRTFTWSVVEQPHFVDYGIKHLQKDELRFNYNLQEALGYEKPNLLIASSVLCYLERPYEWINKFVELRANYILIDRTAFIEGNDEVITIQVVPDEIYKASYPVWFLNEKKFIAAFQGHYDLVRELPDTIDGEDKVDGRRGYRKGFLFKLRQ